MADIKITKLIRKIFLLPDWYVMSEVEEEKLIRYTEEASFAEEARVFRALDCSAFCVNEELCFFCSDLKILCANSTKYSQRH